MWRARRHGKREDVYVEGYSVEWKWGTAGDWSVRMGRCLLLLLLAVALSVSMHIGMEMVVVGHVVAVGRWRVHSLSVALPPLGVVFNVILDSCTP